VEARPTPEWEVDQLDHASKPCWECGCSGTPACSIAHARWGSIKSCFSATPMVVSPFHYFFLRFTHHPLGNASTSREEVSPPGTLTAALTLTRRAVDPTVACDGFPFLSLLENLQSPPIPHGASDWMAVLGRCAWQGRG
jgi:hypothetical protein